MRDGGKLYGFCQDANGNDMQSCYQLANGATEATASNEDNYEFVESENCHMDECNMAVDPEGNMAYFISPNWPYTPRCLKGDVASIYGL